MGGLLVARCVHRSGRKGSMPKAVHPKEGVMSYPGGMTYNELVAVRNEIRNATEGALADVFTTDKECPVGANMNVADGLFAIAEGLNKVARAIEGKS